MMMEVGEEEGPREIDEPNGGSKGGFSCGGNGAVR